MTSPVSRSTVKDRMARRPSVRSSQNPRESSSDVTAKLTSSISAPVIAPSRAPSVAVARRNSGSARMWPRSPRPSQNTATCPMICNSSAGTNLVAFSPEPTQMPLRRVRSSESSACISRPIRLPWHITGMPTALRSFFTGHPLPSSWSGSDYYRRPRNKCCAVITAVFDKTRISSCKFRQSMLQYF